MAVESKKIHPAIEALAVSFEFAMGQLGYKSGSIRYEDGEVRDIDYIDAYGTRCFSTKLGGEWLSLVEQIGGE